MTFLKKTACLLLAVSMCAAAGCSDKENAASSSASDTSSAAETSAVTQTESAEDTQSSESSSESDSSQTDSQSEEYEPGEMLAAEAELFSGSYTYTAKVTYSDYAGETQIVQASDGEKFYQSTSETGTEGLAADNVYIFDGTDGYTIDNNIKAYNKTSGTDEMNIFKKVIEEKLDRTSTHIPEDAEGFTIEEYTYVGDTYMTIYDFYFGEDGAAVKYTATYSVEGVDDVIQTVDIVSITGEADESLFDTSVLSELTDFGSVSEDTRLGFCQGICSGYGITTDEMYREDITTDDLKRIDFDGFLDLVYKYAKTE